jgi:hypothetical protein
MYTNPSERRFFHEAAGNAIRNCLNSHNFHNAQFDNTIYLWRVPKWAGLFPESVRLGFALLFASNIAPPKNYV